MAGNYSTNNRELEKVLTGVNGTNTGAITAQPGAPSTAAAPASDEREEEKEDSSGSPAERLFFHIIMLLVSYSCFRTTGC